MVSGEEKKAFLRRMSIQSEKLSMTLAEHDARNKSNMWHIELFGDTARMFYKKLVNKGDWGDIKLACVCSPICSFTHDDEHSRPSCMSVDTYSWRHGHCTWIF